MPDQSLQMPLGTVCGLLLLPIRLSHYKIPAVSVACKFKTKKAGLSLSRLLKDELKYVGKLVGPQIALLSLN